LRKFLAIGVLGLGLTACTEVPTRSSPIDLPATTSGPRILAIGDSLMSECATHPFCFTRTRLSRCQYGWNQPVGDG
ncbi:MAG: hypothetical protein AAF352_06085, partial [Pseudomonadota bacterium]